MIESIWQVSNGILTTCLSGSSVADLCGSGLVTKIDITKTTAKLNFTDELFQEIIEDETQSQQISTQSVNTSATDTSATRTVTVAPTVGGGGGGGGSGPYGWYERYRTLY